jgi:PAS domain S-box-containing protein
VILGGLPVPVLVLDADGTVLSSNPAARAALGEAVSAAGTCAPFVEPTERPAFVAALRRVAGGAAREIEVACAVPRAGRRRFQAAPLTLDDGGRAAVLVEVSPGRAKPDAVEICEHERQLHFTLEALPTPIWLKDAAGIYVGCNAAFARFLGLPRDRIVGGTVFDVAPPDLAASYRAADEALLRSGNTQTYETRVEWADRSRRDVVFFKSVIRDAAGEVVGLAGTMLDVTAQRAAEHALRIRLAQQEALASLARRALEADDFEVLVPEAIRAVMAGLEADGGAVLEIVSQPGGGGLRPLGVIGPMPPAALEPRAFDALADAVLSASGPVFLEDLAAMPRGAAPDGLRAFGARFLAAARVGSREAPLAILTVYAATPRVPAEEDLRFLDAVTHVLAIAIARRRADASAEQARAKLAISDRLASIGTLAAGVAHELNNPLAFVRGNIEWAAQELGALRGLPGVPPLDEAVAALGEALEGSERMRLIVRDLRTLSAAGDEERAPVELARVLEFSARLAAAELRHRGRVVWALAPMPPVRGSEARLGQVFLNLLVNAAHALPVGAEDAEIRVRSGVLPGDRVAVEISDTGSGIPPEVRARIFDPFFTTKPIGVGTGLGLWVCHNIVSAHGGEIEVESAPGAGSTFRVILPAAAPVASPVAASPVAASPVAARPPELETTRARRG